MELNGRVCSRGRDQNSRLLFVQGVTILNAKGSHKVFGDGGSGAHEADSHTVLHFNRASHTWLIDCDSKTRHPVYDPIAD
jgi:hypothetical protein